MVVKTLPEDRLIRKAVVQGISRLLRDVYDQDAVGPVPGHIGQLLARLDTVKPSLRLKTPPGPRPCGAADQEMPRVLLKWPERSSPSALLIYF